MFVSTNYKPGLFNAHTMIFIVHISTNVNKLCLNHFILTATATVYITMCILKNGFNFMRRLRVLCQQSVMLGQ